MASLEQELFCYFYHINPFSALLDCLEPPMRDMKIP